MLRKESAHADQEGRPIVTRAEESGGKMYRSAFILTSLWIDNVLDIYKPELKRLLWPLFVYSFLNLVADYYPRAAKSSSTNSVTLSKASMRTICALYSPSRCQSISRTTASRSSTEVTSIGSR